MKFTRPLSSGFSLVELLVVITLITLLLALLLPALKSARQAAWTIGCATKQRTIGIASLTYSVDHRGYFPLAFYSRNQGPSQFIELFWPLTVGYENYMQMNPTDKSWEGPFMCPAYTNDGILPRSTIQSRIILNRSYSVARSLGQYRYDYQYPNDSPWLTHARNIRRLNNPASTAWLADGTQFNATQLNYAGSAEILIYGVRPFFGPMDRHAGGSNNILFADGHVKNMGGDDLSDQVASFWLHPLP